MTAEEIIEVKLPRSLVEHLIERLQGDGSFAPTRSDIETEACLLNALDKVEARVL